MPDNIRKLFIISGPSGAGKTVLCRELLAAYPDLFKYSISTTTREPRGNEKEGEEYNFTTVDKFKEMIAREEFLEWAKVHGNYYGTPEKNLIEAFEDGKSFLLNIDVVGAQKLKRKKVAGIFIFISPPSFEILEDRLLKRGLEKEAAFKRRLANAKREMQTNLWYDFILVNDDFKTAVRELEGIIISCLESEEVSEFY
ncbi:guanylate kinase [Candidatus Riflebacteria bacterium]